MASRKRDGRAAAGAAPAPPRKRPQQERSRATVASVREACLQVLDREGAAALTVNRIAEASGVAVGSIYQYFPNKEAIVAAVYDGVAEAELRAMRGLGGALGTLSLEELLRLLLDKAVARERRLMKLHREFYRRHYRRYEVVHRWAREAGDDAGERGGALASEALLQVLERERDKLRVRDLRLAAFLVTRGMRAVIWTTLEERPESLSDPAFLDELVDMSLRYLLADPP